MFYRIFPFYSFAGLAGNPQLYIAPITVDPKQSLTT